MVWELLFNLHPDCSLAVIGTAAALGIGAGVSALAGGIGSAINRRSPGDILGQNPVNPQDIQNATAANNWNRQQQQDFINALSSRQDGIGNQNQIFGRGLETMNDLQGQAQGLGPNPAMAQLALTTGQNMQNQAALLAGQRGVGANPGLAARQIGQIGSNAQQQAVGQGAVMRANQQLAAQQQLQQQQAFLAQMAGQQISQRQGAMNSFGSQQSDFLRALMGGQASYNQAAAGIEGQNAAANSQLWGSLIGAGGSLAAGGLGGAGIVKPGSLGGGAVSAGSPKMNPMQPMSTGGKVQGKAKTEGDSEKNDTVPALLSPGEVVIPRTAVKDPKKVAAFINETLGMNLKVGKKA